MCLDEISLVENIGNEIEFFALLTKIENKRGTSNYVNLTVRAGTVCKIIKWWNKTVTDDEIKELTGRVYRFSANVSEYNNEPSLIFYNMKSTNLERENFFPCDKNFTKTLQRLENLLKKFQFKTDILYDVTEHILHKYKEEYEVSPAAAKHHHSILNGLLLHSVEVAEFALANANCINSVEDDKVDSDLILAASLLHDIGKIKELSFNFETGEIKYTVKGNMVGHPVLGVEIVNEAISDLLLDPDHPSLVHLKHIILSHHGKLEWGSPVLPCSVEARIVHSADMASATYYDYDLMLQDIKPGEIGTSYRGGETYRAYKRES